jgi:Glycoside Hydrolase Family 113
MRRFTERYSVATLLFLGVATVSGTPHVLWANPAVYEIGDDPGIGFNLISWSSGSSATTWQNAVQSMYDAGFREVSISPVRFTNILTGDIVLSPSQQPTLAAVEAGVVRAKQLGMRVTLNAFWENYDPTETSGQQYFADTTPGPDSGCTWRGCYNPSGAVADNFWTNYQSYLLEVAAIAEAHGVEAMTIGTEYNAIDGDPTHNANWSTAISAVDAVYHGQLGYAANHDHYDNDNVRDTIWENPAIDFIGIDSYFTNLLTGSTGYLRHQDPNLSNSQANALANQLADTNTGLNPGDTLTDLMTDAWNYKLESQILPFAAARKGGAGMPVEFTEVGYLPYNRTIRNPQNSSGQNVDTAEQIAAFNGLINALDGRADVFEAMHIWQWHIPGSDGSLWNIDPTLPANQPNNTPLGQWLSSFVNTDVLPLAGDYNRDGVVDAADYTTWRNSLGSFVASYNAADGDGSGLVDAGDYDVWKANFGATLGGGSVASVPEPGSIGLVLFAFAGASLGRRRDAYPAT